MRSKKIIAIIFSLIMAASLEMFLLLFSWWYAIIPVSIMAIIVSLRLLTVEKIFGKMFWMYVITPVFFSLSILGLTALLENYIVQQVLIGGGALLHWLYLSNVAIFNFDFQKYHAAAIENVSSYMNLISLFCFSIVAYAAEALLGFSLGIMGTLLLVFVVLILLQSIWAARIDSPKRYLYVVAMAIILVEGFWALAYLPSNFYLQGFLLTVAYYGVWGLMKSNLLGIFSKRLLIRYLGACTVAVLAVIITAQWI